VDLGEKKGGKGKGTYPTLRREESTSQCILLRRQKVGREKDLESSQKGEGREVGERGLREQVRLRVQANGKEKRLLYPGKET